MVRVGVHVSIAKSFDTAVDTAVAEKCDVFQVFTRNPRGWKFNNLDPEEVKSFREKLAKTGLNPVVDHMPYLPNLSCPEDELYKKSVDSLVAEVDRCVELGIPYLVTHLGSHLGKGREIGLKRISNALNQATQHAKGDFQICLENMAGTSNSMGSKFEEVREIFDGVKQKERVGVCLDTCLPAGSLVFTNDVPRPVELVKPNDSVVGLDGVTDRVVKVFRRPYEGRMVSIKPEGLPWTRMTAEHPVLCLRPNGWRFLDSKPWRIGLTSGPAWIHAGAVKPGYFVVMPKLSATIQDRVDLRPYIGSATRRFPFPTILPLTGRLAELLGLYLSEGFTFMGKSERGDNGKVFFSFGRHEKSLIERARELIDELFSLKTWIDESSTSTKVVVGSNILVRFFKENFGLNAANKRIPSFVLRASPECVKSFLRGYLSGDGCVDRRGLRYITVSRTVAYQLVHLLARIDIRGTISKHRPTSGSIEGRRVASLGWYTVHVASHEARKLGFAYEFPAAAPRRILRDQMHFYMPVREIAVEQFRGTVYNLETENSTFAAPFIVTHNCHAYAAGYDLHVEKAVDRTLSKFDETVGFENLKVVHLNDSEDGLGSGHDRHQHIGLGYIGTSGFKAILHHKAIKDQPLILETPIDERRGNAGNLETVRKLAK